MLFEKLAEHGDKIALLEGKVSLSYRKLMQEVSSRAEQLDADTVLSIELDNGIEWILWDLAALKAGAVCVPIPPFFTENQIRHVLGAAGVTLRATRQGIIETGNPRGAGIHAGTAKITFTSGTTGTPKGVCLSEKSLLDVAISITDRLGDDFVGTHVSILPLAILLENVAGVYAALIAGSRVCLHPLGDFGQNYAALHSVLIREKATTAILVPELLRLLMVQVRHLGNIPTLKFLAVGGSRVDGRMVMGARHMGLPVYEGYGLSECASVVALNSPGIDKPGTVGKLLPHIEVAVKKGEILIKNPPFLGYVGEVASDPFPTGDLGQFDEDGFLHIQGRKKNVLITSFGRNISPEWVESCFLMQPEILQVVVYGDGEPHLRALLSPTHDAADLAAAVDRANEMLPDYAQVKDFKRVPPFTVENGFLTGTGRPRRDRILADVMLETGDI